jgi:regulatory protein
MDLLARREHSRAELSAKLADRGAGATLLEQVLDGLEADGLLSEERFVEAFLNQQLQRGRGPIAIEHGLRERGVSGSVLALALESLDVDWAARAREQRQRRFGATSPASVKEYARQARFLRARGFTGEQVHQALGASPPEFQG